MILRTIALTACCAIGILAALSISDTDLEGRVERVIDGDTFVLSGTRIRLWGIDAPDIRSPNGPSAKAALAALIDEQRLRCNTKDNDRYRRVVAQCFIQGKDVAAEMIRSGYAHDWPRYSGGYYDK